MKFKMLAIILALTAVSWAQTATQNNPSPTPNQSAAPTSPVEAKAACPCCQKMDSKDAAACCSHHNATGKDKTEAMSCCGGKDAKCNRKSNRSADASCGKGKCCGSDGKDCCTASEKNTDQTAMACCKAAHCGMDRPSDQGMTN